MPEYETRRTAEGTEIAVETEKEIALVVREKGDERIFLPPFDVQQDSYYVEPGSGMVETENGYTIVYPGEPDEIELFSR